MRIEVEYPDDRENCVVEGDSWIVEEGGVLCVRKHTESPPGQMKMNRVPIVRIAPPYTAERFD